MITKIDDVDAIYPTFIKAEIANEYWRNQVGENFSALCFLRIYDAQIEDDKEFWANAKNYNALKGIAYYTDHFMATEHVLAFRTQSDAILWKLAHGGE